MVAKRKKFIGGNWKLNGSRALVNSYFSQLSDSLTHDILALEMAIFPPSIYISRCTEEIKECKYKISIGAQNFYYEDNGAYTGELR